VEKNVQKAFKKRAKPFGSVPEFKKSVLEWKSPFRSSFPLELGKID
jgi:hypothetical protein